MVVCVLVPLSVTVLKDIMEWIAPRLIVKR